MKRRFVIRDGTKPGGPGRLEFDLPEILAALGERVLTSEWRVRNLSYVSKDEQDVAVLDAMARGAAVSGHDLVTGIEQLRQLIDGEFVATEWESGTAMGRCASHRQLMVGGCLGRPRSSRSCSPTVSRG